MFFLLGVLRYSHVANTIQRLKVKVSNNKFDLSIKSLILIFFSNFFFAHGS
jgi:hypothetical protein